MTYPRRRTVYQQSPRWLKAGVFDAMVQDRRAVSRVAQGNKAEPSAASFARHTLQATPASGSRAGYDGAKRRRGSKVHTAVDTLGHLLAAHVTAASEQDRSQVQALAEKVQEVTSDAVEVVCGPRIYGRASSPGCPRPAHAPGGGQAARGEKMGCTAATAVGGETESCVGSALSPLGARLRTVGRDARRCIALLEHQEVRQDRCGTHVFGHWHGDRRQGSYLVLREMLLGTGYSRPRERWRSRSYTHTVLSGKTRESSPRLVLPRANSTSPVISSPLRARS